MNIERIVHTVAELTDGSFVVYNADGDVMTTFTIEPSDGRSFDQQYAVVMASVFRRMVSSGSLVEPF